MPGPFEPRSGFDAGPVQVSEAQEGANHLAAWAAPFQRLGLSAAEIAILRSQGFVTKEVRKNGATIYKLRFRFDGRQRVKNLGTDRAVAERVEGALEVSQRARRLGRRLRAVGRDTAKLLKESKRRLALLVEQAGYKFHGRVSDAPVGIAKPANLYLE